MKHHVFVRRIWMISILSAMVCFASNLKKLSFAWDFTHGKLLKYHVHQSSRSQRKSFNFEMKKWVKMPVRGEVIDGICYLQPQGDGNAAGDVYLRLVELTENKLRLPIPPGQDIVQHIARFTLTPSGTFEDYSSNAVKETYILLRLVFGLPPTPLEMHEGRVFPFKLYTKHEPSSMEVRGTVTHELKSFEIIPGDTCAIISTTINFESSPDIKGKQGKVTWKGTGTSRFAVNRQRLLRAEWKLAKKTDTAIGDVKAPTIFTEIFDITVVLEESDVSS